MNKIIGGFRNILKSRLDLPFFHFLGILTTFWSVIFYSFKKSFLKFFPFFCRQRWIFKKILAAGTSDFKCRIFSTYLREIEEKPGPTTWGRKMPFGQLMKEYGQGLGGWVHGVEFNTNGEKLAFVSHDSSVGFATGEMEQATVTR